MIEKKNSPLVHLGCTMYEHDGMPTKFRLAELARDFGIPYDKLFLTGPFNRGPERKLWYNVYRCDGKLPTTEDIADALVKGIEKRYSLIDSLKRAIF